ncbi:MAG: type II secretion system protein GspM [Casimicrobiaceae bacterium]
MALTLHALSPALASAWDRASRRERTMIVAAAVVLIGAAGWSWLWQPMHADIARLARDLPRAHGVLAAARAQAGELIALQRASGTARSGDPRAAVERVLAERNLRPAVTALDVQDGRVRLTFAAVRFDTLVAMLDSLARTDGLRAVDAVLAARVEPGTVRAELTFARSP